MGRTLLVTGVTGALGPPLLVELLRDEDNEVCAVIRDGHGAATRLQNLRTAMLQMARTEGLPATALLQRLHPVAGDVRGDGLQLERRERDRLTRTVNAVIHAAAITRFTAPAADLREVNVNGTRRVLDFARRCRRLQQLVLVSTTCVSGTRTGLVAEQLQQTENTFVNAYEQTKSSAEQLLLAAGVPARIARLSTCIGAAGTGYVHRFGAIHHSIRWLARGLIPMLPAHPAARVDLITTDLAARWLARAVTQPVEGLDVCHVAAGQAAIPVGELVDAAVAHLRASTSGWSGRQLAAPVVVDPATFELFEQSVRRSGDALFARVLHSAQSLVPALLYPKLYVTHRAEEVWGGALPLADWRTALRQVMDFGTAHNWRAPRRVKERVHA